jgi:hypothetical protein
MDGDRRAAERFATTVDLFETGVRMRRQSLRRAHPDLSDLEIDALLARWLRERPGAEDGDGPQRTT